MGDVISLKAVQINEKRRAVKLAFFMFSRLAEAMPTYSFATKSIPTRSWVKVNVLLVDENVYLREVTLIR